MPRAQIKLVEDEGRVLALGQLVQARGACDQHGQVGRIVGFVRSVDGSLIIAKIRMRGTRRIIRLWVQDIEEAA